MIGERESWQTDRPAAGQHYKIAHGAGAAIMGSQLIQMAYNLIDMLWIGRVGAGAVAAVGAAGMFNVAFQRAGDPGPHRRAGAGGPEHRRGGTRKGRPLRHGRRSWAAPGGGLHPACSR